MQIRLDQFGKVTLGSDANGIGRQALLGPGKPAALLAFLLAASHRRATREEMAEALWADVDITAARHTLRQTVWYIKKKVGYDLIVAEGDTLRIDGDVPNDRDDFLAALDRDDLDAAFTIYTGDFFPGFAAPGGAGFEQWADLERHRLRGLFVGAAGRLVRVCLEAGRAREALTIARRARDLAPSAQATWRMVVEAHLAADDLVGAKVELARLTRTLATDEIDAEPATTQLQRRIDEKGRPQTVNGQTPRDTPSGALTGELVGRDAEFAALVRGAEHSTHGARVHIHITAPAGFGKTRLLDGLAARLRSQRGARPRVVSVRAIPAERNLPFALVGHLVGALASLRGATAVAPDVASTLVALAPAASTYFTAAPDVTQGDDARRRRALALADLVAAVADEAPLVLLVDDVHWMDADSRDALATAIARTDRAHALIVTTARPGDTFIERTPGATRLTLTALHTDDIAEWVASIAQLPDESWVEPLPALLSAASGGSPLLLLTCLQLALDQQVLGIAGGTWRCDTPVALFALLGEGQALRHRLDALPPSARDLLLRIAVLGAPVAEDALVPLVSRPVDDDLRILESRAFLSRDVDGLRVAHDEVALAIVDYTPTRARQLAHAAAATWLASPLDATHAQLIRATWHAVRADDVAMLDRVFARLVIAAGAELDRRHQLRLAREAYGEQATDVACAALVARLPDRLRRRRAPHVWLAPLALAAALLFIAVREWRRVASPHDPLTRVVVHAEALDGREHWLQVSVRASAIADAGAIDAEETVPPLAARGLGILDQLGALLDDGSLLGGRVVTNPASNAYDIVRLLPSMELRPFATGRADQSQPMLSPNHQWVAYHDRAFSPLQHTDVMLRAVDGSGERHVTSTEANEGSVLWSPSSDSVAYYRIFDDTTAAQVCWRPIVAGTETCRSIPRSVNITRVNAWRTDDQFVLQGELRASGRAALLMLRRSTGTIQILDSTSADYQVDPTGTVALCRCDVSGVDGQVPAMFAIANPAAKRALRFGGQWLARVRYPEPFWSRRSDALADIVVAAPESASVGDPVQLVVSGRAANGDVQPVLERRYRSLTPTIATVDADGLVTPTRLGTARVAVTVERRFVDTVAIAVTPEAGRSLSAEAWQDASFAAWWVFGNPAPTIAASSDSLLSVNGDERLASGVVSRAAFDARAGLGLRTRFRMRTTLPQWQSLRIALDYVANDSTLRNWTTRSEGLFSPSWNLRDTRACAFIAPRGEGGHNRGLVSVIAGTEAVVTEHQPGTFGDGAWHSVDIQILRDGRCAVALDGRLLGISRSAITTDLPLRVLLSGAAVRTHVEVGAVELRRGVRPDGPWAVTTATARR